MDYTNIRNAIETMWAGRVKSLHLVPGTREFYEKQAEFFAGAMTALNAAFPHPDGDDKLSTACPPSWWVSIMAASPIAVEEPEMQGPGEYLVQITKTAVMTIEANDGWDAIEKAESRDDDGEFADWRMTGDIEVIDFQRA